MFVLFLTFHAQPILLSNTASSFTEASDNIGISDIATIDEPPHDKTNKMTMRPAKTQISLGIHPVWSESSLCAQWVAKDPRFLHADSKDSDQTGRTPRLIWVFAGRTATLLVLSWGAQTYYPSSKWQSCWSDCPDEEFFDYCFSLFTICSWVSMVSPSITHVFAGHIVQTLIMPYICILHLYLT